MFRYSILQLFSKKTLQIMHILQATITVGLSEVACFEISLY